MGIVPNNSGGFGSVTDAEDVFYSKEIVPLQSRLSQINELTGIELIRFKEYDLKNLLKNFLWLLNSPIYIKLIKR